VTYMKQRFLTIRSAHCVLVALLVVTCFEIRGVRLSVGPLLFYWTTARLAIPLFCLTSLWWFCSRELSVLWKEYRAIFVASGVFFGAACLAVALNDYRGPGLEQLLYYASFFYLFLFFLAYPDDELWTFIPHALYAFGILIGIVGVAEHFSQPLWHFLNRTVRSAANGELYFKGRSLSTLQHPTVLGACMVISSVLGLVVKRFESWKAVVVEAIFLMATIFSHSRIALIMLCGVYVLRFYSFVRREYGARVAILAGCVFFAFSVALMTREPRMRESFQEVSGKVFTAEGVNTLFSRRLEFWQEAWNIWGQHKLFGVGVGNYKYYTEKYTITPHSDHPHNLLLRVLCETGLFGFFWFLILAGYMARKIFAKGLLPYSWPLLVFLFFELIEEFTRDVYPSLLFLLLAVYAIRASDGSRSS